MIPGIALLLPLLALSEAAGGRRADRGNAAQEDKEPPLLFVLEADGKKIPIEEDKPFHLDTAAGKTHCVLRVEPFRVFQHGGVVLHYPREFNFEADLDTPGVKLWTLSGNNAVLMVQRHAGQADPAAVQKQLVQEMIARYKKPNVRETTATIELEKKAVKGAKLVVTLAGQTLIQVFYSFKTGKDTLVLMTQDCPADDGSPSRDAQKAEKLLRESFKVTER